MDYQLLKYHITPRVVCTNKAQEIQIKGLDESSEFFDDVEYLVSVQRTDGFNYAQDKELYAGGRDLVTEYKLYPKNKVISFSHHFDFEGEWVVKISRLETEKHIPYQFIKHFPAGKNRMITGFSFKVYAVGVDLYGRRPFKGDLHSHTFGSDGMESGKFVAARYRQFGYDFLAITDHYCMSPSVDTKEFYKDVDFGLKLFVGEEVHPIDKGGIFHVVNINGKQSVNDIYNTQPEKAQEEIKEIAKTMNTGSSIDDIQLAYFKWIFDKIREVGGIAIYPHAFWQVGGGYHVRPEISDRILKDKMCDAYEILGGMSKRDNREMIEYYHALKAQGIDLPIVASSDSHSTLKSNSVHFNDVFTVVFAKNKEEILSSILDKYVVAVENFNPADKSAYGELRLVRYTYFLLEQYFEMHDELCMATGQATLRYALGDKEQKPLVEKLQSECEKFENSFFGI